jgi:hypothetical protein
MHGRGRKIAEALPARRNERGNDVQWREREGR